MAESIPDQEHTESEAVATRVIHLRVGDVPLAITIPREEEAEAALRAAAKELNRLLEEYRERYDLTPLELLTYAAIHLGRDKQELLRHREQADYERRIGSLADEIDRTLGEGQSASPR